MISVHVPDYARFLRGELSAGENRRIVRHLLAAWRVCRDGIGQLWGGGRPPSAGPRTSTLDYDRAFSGLGAGLAGHIQEVAGERQRLPLLIERLRDLPPDERRALLDSDPAFHNWPFGEWLIEESRRTFDADLGRAEGLAGEAVAVAESLPAGPPHGAALVQDLKARAWACRGEALRRRSDLRGAEEAFAVAERFLAQGTGDALEEAQILELKAALYRDQHRADEARHLLEEVFSIYRQYGDPHLTGRAFIQKGRVHGHAHDLDGAIRWLRKGLALIDPARERSLDLSARHSLMLYLHESGRPREARFLLKASAPEFQKHGSPRLILRLRWLEGKIYDALGFLAEAEKALLEARQGFAGLGIGFSAAAVSLDLAGLYAAQGRAAEMRGLAEETLPIFQSRDLHREAIAALLAIRQAARMETMNAQLLAEIRAHLDRARQDPKLRFEPL